MTDLANQNRASSRRIRALFVFVTVAAGVAAWLLIESRGNRGANGHTEISDHGSRPPGAFVATEAQWATLGVEPVKRQVFRAAHVTEGKIAVDEDRSTLIFSPYAGRVTKLLAKPGDTVTSGQPLFVVEATDMVQAQNDFINAITGMNKARSQLVLAE